jgi:hypothetical protein
MTKPASDGGVRVVGTGSKNHRRADEEPFLPHPRASAQSQWTPKPSVRRSPALHDLAQCLARPLARGWLRLVVVEAVLL